MDSYTDFDTNEIDEAFEAHNLNIATAIRDLTSFLAEASDGLYRAQRAVEELVQYDAVEYTEAYDATDLGHLLNDAQRAVRAAGAIHMLAAQRSEG